MSIRDAGDRQEKEGGKHRSPKLYRVFQKMTVKEALDLHAAQKLEGEVIVYIHAPSRMAMSRKQAIRDTAEERETDGVEYAAVADSEFTEHAPRKSVRYE